MGAKMAMLCEREVQEGVLAWCEVVRETHSHDS